jgi:hypothetical protein
VLSGLLGGGAARSILSGGLGDLLKQFQQNGQGDKAESWIASGPNKQGKLMNNTRPVNWFWSGCIFEQVRERE